MTRPLRALFLASDGRSGGHVTRALAVARALKETDPRVQVVLATTSRADGLLRASGVTFVRLPGPLDAAGMAEPDRRRLLATTLEGLAEGFSPDLLVVDTFPSGPHLEAAGLLRRVPFRALVRRAVRPDRSADAEACANLGHYQLALLPADPLEPAETSLEVLCVRVPPITLLDTYRPLTREDARRALGLGDGRWILISTGAGGDPEAVAIAAALAEEVTSRGLRPWIAGLPELMPEAAIPRVPPPLAPYLRAFDAAIAAAGYNTAHELALAGVPSLLFARPRPYDDQEARARRFQAAGLARFLPSLDHRANAAAFGAALDSLDGLRPAPLAGGGASAAARELLALVSTPVGPAARRASPERARA